MTADGALSEQKWHLLFTYFQSSKVSCGSIREGVGDGGSGVDGGRRGGPVIRQSQVGGSLDDVES